MKITFFRNNQKGNWIGSIRCLNMFAKGLKQLKHDVQFTNDIAMAFHSDIVFLDDTARELNALKSALDIIQKPYYLIPFHCNYHRYLPAAYTFYGLIKHFLYEKPGAFTLSHLIAHPELILHNCHMPTKRAIKNFDVIKDAKLVITTSDCESQNILRDCPSAKTDHIFLAPKQVDINDSDQFIQYSGLCKKGYILQIGRLEIRKNQLATVLATKDLDIPLVFISSHIFDGMKEYLQTMIDAILKWRKAPTYIFSEHVENKDIEQLKLRKITTLFDDDMIKSAYQNASVYVHPAFCELPGYVYLEAAKLGTPSVASTWASINEYFIENGAYTLDDRIAYVEPYDIRKISEAIKRQLIKNFSISKHRIFQRTEIHLARELLKSLNTNR